MSHRSTTSLAGLRRVAQLVLVLTLPAAPLAASPAPMTVLFMGVASAGGAAGTFWSSELVLVNVNEYPSEVRLEIVPRGSATVAAGTTLTLAAGETRSLPDVYAALGAEGGAGTLRVTGDVLAWMRTFNRSASGTFGMGVPSVTGATAFGADGMVYFPVSTPTDPQKDFRSNLLLLNLEATAATFTVSSGEVSKTLAVDPGTFKQVDGVGGWLGLTAGKAVLSIRSTGSWHGLVTTIDPATGDPTAVRGLRATTRTVTLFNGVASAGGAGGTAWRSEAQLFNAGAAAASVLLELIPRGESGVSASKTVTLAPGETKLLADVYTTLGVASGAGTLKVTGDVLTWVRTFNQGVGVTFGTEVPEVAAGIGYGTGAVALYPIVVPADASKDFRSNFLVYNHESRPITLTLTSGTASRPLDVPANTFAQKDYIGNWIGLAPGTTSVQVTGTGRWSGLVTTVDPGLGDPTGHLGLLATPNPAPTGVGDAIGNPISASIGPAGGTLSSADGKVKLTVPAGALASAVTLTLQPVTNLAWGGIGDAWALGPAGTTFASAATLSFPAIDEAPLGVSLGGLGIAVQDGDGYWQWKDEATRDDASKTISLTLSSLGATAPAPIPTSLRSPAPLAPDGVTVFTLASLCRLSSDRVVVQPNQTANLHVEICYPPRNGSTHPQPSAGFPCTASLPKGLSGLEAYRWTVEDIPGGNAQVGTVAEDPTASLIKGPSSGSSISAAFKAPAKRPSPRTEMIKVYLRAPFMETFLGTPISIVGQLKGTFTVDIHWIENGGAIPDFHLDGLEAVATPVSSDGYSAFATAPDDVVYELSAKLNLKPPTFTPDPLVYTCEACSGISYSSYERHYPWPPDFFIVNFAKKNVRWHFHNRFVYAYHGGGTSGTVAFDMFFSTAAGRQCIQPRVEPVDDPFNPKGSFPMTCLNNLVSTGAWDFKEAD